LRTVAGGDPGPEGRVRVHPLGGARPREQLHEHLQVLPGRHQLLDAHDGDEHVGERQAHPAVALGLDNRERARLRDSEVGPAGRHHGWSSTPTRDLVTYVLGIRPEEPGFAVALVAPRLGDLVWARGAAPTPHGFVSVEAGRDAIESPVPVLLDLPGRPAERLPAGRHHIK